MLATFVLLTLAIVGLWISPARGEGHWSRHWWLGPFALAVGSGIWHGIVEPLGAVWIAATTLAAAAFGRETLGPRLRAVAGCTLFVLGAGLLSHRLPGFHNPRVISDALFTADAIPFRLYFNFDKASFGLLFIGLCHARLRQRDEWRLLLRRAAPVAGGVIVTVLALSLAMGYVRLSPKLPRETWLWIWSNLAFTCLAEEAFFRGFIQAQLHRLAQATPRGEDLALLTAAVAFGLAHAAGGPWYVLLSTAAGIGYGWAYRRAGYRIEAAILTHFTLNAVHFFAFTYPALRRVGS